MKTTKNRISHAIFTRISDDSNGTPRYVCHFLNLLKDGDCEFATINKDGTLITSSDVARIVYKSDLTSLKYQLALKRAKKIGGKKFHNKQYGGGIVFKTDSLDQLCHDIYTLLK